MSQLASQLFYGLAFLTGVFALASVFTKNILRSAIYLMGVLCLSAGLYLVLGAEFLAGVQVLVYVGGIVVLLVFAVMLTRSDDLDEDRPTLARRVFGLLVSSAFFAGSLTLIQHSPLGIAPGPVGPSVATTEEIGRRFLDMGPKGYVLPFEVISLLLLAVLIGGIVLARKETER